MNIIIITGASSGMGRECAKQLDKIFSDKIDEFWLIARREEKLTELSFSLSHNCRIIPMDLTNSDDLVDLKVLLNSIKPNVKMLINASGFGILGRFDKSSIEEQTGMIRLNCEALVYVTRIVLDYMHKNSRIIQFASSAAFVPQANFDVYAASKSFVLSFSRSLNQELKNRKICVTAVCPGPVKTEFFDIAEKNGSNLSIKKYFMSDPVDVVWQALYDSYKRKTISVYSAPMKAVHTITKFVPDDVVLNIMSRLK